MMFFGTPRLSSQHLMFTGRVAPLELVVNATSMASFMPEKNFLYGIPEKILTAIPRNPNVWIDNPISSVSAYQNSVSRISNPNSPTVAAIRAKTPYGATFMIIPTILIIVSLKPSKKSITGLDLLAGTRVRLTPIIRAKNTICSISPSASALIGFVATIFTSIPTRSTGGTSALISVWNSANSFSCASGASCLPGCIRLTSVRPIVIETVIVMRYQPIVFPPSFPTLRMSPRLAAPTMSEARTSGIEMNIRSRMKIFPTGLMTTARLFTFSTETIPVSSRHSDVLPDSRSSPLTRIVAADRSSLPRVRENRRMLS